MNTPSRALASNERRQRNRDDMTAAILTAAREIMREQGVADLNLQELARRVGMRAPSLYNYFAGKHAIYDALFGLGMRLWRERLEPVLDQYGSAFEALEQVMNAYLSFALENPELYQLMFERPVPGFEPSAEALAESRRLLGRGQQAVEQMIAAGTIQTAHSAEVTLNLLIAMMHGVTALHLANEPQQPAESGRFGSLIPVIIALLRQAWTSST